MARASARTRWIPVFAVLLCAVVLALAGCGSSSSSSSKPSASGSASGTTKHVSAPKTKFVIHAGLAFGAFHRWIYTPYKAGDFSHPSQHKATIVKAAAAAAFVYHELKLALADAQADPTLSHLVAPITALQNKVRGLGSEVKSGNTSSIESTNSDISSVKGQSAAAGHPINEQAPASP